MSLPGHRDVVVSEYGHALGELDGILVLHYARHDGPVRVPEVRDEFRHQTYWAPHGWLAMSRGDQLSYAGPTQAVWVRPGVSAEIQAPPGHPVLSAYLRVEPRAVDGREVCVLELDEPARSAWSELARGPLPRSVALAARARLLNGMTAADGPLAAEHTTMSNPCPPRRPRRALANTVASAVMAAPGDRTELSEWARRLNVSSRTLQRDFERTFGSTFSRWRTQQRLAASVPLLGLHPVCDVAHLVGFCSASAYVAAFRREYGITPGQVSSTRR